MRMKNKHKIYVKKNIKGNDNRKNIYNYKYLINYKYKYLKNCIKDKEIYAHLVAYKVLKLCLLNHRKRKKDEISR